eukprot:UN24504
MHSFRDNPSGTGENSATNSEALTAHLQDENKLGELLQRDRLEFSKPNMPSRKHLKFIKLFGERNSGTGFLNLLMTRNIKGWSAT